MASCDECLRRGYLVGRLAGRIAGLLDRPGRRAAGLLALDDERLIAAVAGDTASDARAFLEAFDPAVARARLEAGSLGAVCRHVSEYPRSLLALGDAPAVLFTAGGGERGACLAAAPANAVALVGTRNASPYGLEMAYELGRGLGAAGVTVVSGLALGIDAAAHRGCVDAGGPAVAVLAGGPDIPYPRTNRRLYERVRATGVVLAELPPGQRAYRWAFPARNRIMAGLAAVTVVVEAADPSGSLITSVFAADLGRTVAAVPGRATSRFSAGSNRLLADGARMVTSAQDVLDELYCVGSSGPGAYGEPARGGGSAPGVDGRAPQPRRAPASQRGEPARRSRSATGTRDSTARHPRAATRPGDSAARHPRQEAGAGDPAARHPGGTPRSLDAVEGRVLDALEAGLGIDGICAHAGLPVREARALLARLEASGHLRRDGLGGYRRTAALR